VLVIYFKIFLYLLLAIYFIVIYFKGLFFLVPIHVDRTRLDVFKSVVSQNSP
jgi:hypothetical protein